MPKKYIKGQDGKFQGSVPDGLSVPKSPSTLPRKSSLSDWNEEEQPRAHFRKIAEQYAEKMKDRDGRSALELEKEEWLADTGGEELFIDNRTNDISGNVAMTPEGKFIGEIQASYLDRTKTLDSKEFTHPTEAEDWVEHTLKTRADEIYEFEQAYSYSPTRLNELTDKTLAVVPGWHEETHEVRGTRIGFMRGATRGATVQRLGPSGHLIMVHDYSDSNDEEGELYTERHLPDFDTAWSMARYLCAKKL